MSRGAAIRAAIWLAVAAIAWLAPRMGDTLFRRWERIASRFAEKRGLCCMAAALFVLLTRVVLLPLWPIPKPYVYDEFGYILQADTFASGRLTNPPHPLAPFFETIYELQTPTYNAKFPPGQGLMLAVGQTMFGHPWFGVWLSCGLLAAALCWALQGWVPSSWALFGSLIALPLCLTSYWMNTFWGGAVTAIGGALVIGAYARLIRRGSHSSSWLLALGAVLLVYTRPFEGCLLLGPVFAMLLAQRIGWKHWSAILLVGMLAASWLGYYDYRVTGKATLLPYIEYDRQYPSTPHFNILPLPPPHQFPHLDFTLMDRWEREAWAKARSVGFFAVRSKNVLSMFELFLGNIALLLPVALFWRNLLSPRLKVLWWALGTGSVAVFLGLQYYQHYAAPILIVILLFTVEAFRHLRVFEVAGKPVGRFLCRSIPAVMLLLTGGHAAVDILRQKTLEETYPPNARRERLEDAMTEQHPGGNVVFVRYTNYRFPQEEWIYNRADIDNAPVVWAQDMGPEENRRVVEYFKGRSFWLLKPDEDADVAVSYDPSENPAK